MKSEKFLSYTGFMVQITLQFLFLCLEITVSFTKRNNPQFLMENSKMKLVSMGSKKKVYRSIKLAAEAAGMPYITFYMRLRAGDKPVTAAKKLVRKYEKVEG